MKHSTNFTIGLAAMLCLILMSFSTEENVQPQTGIANNYEKELSIANFPSEGDVIVTVNKEGLTVTSFRFVIAPESADAHAYMRTYNGNLLNSTSLSKIRNASPGDRILIDQVKAKYSNGLITLCKPATYRLVE